MPDEGGDVNSVKYSDGQDVKRGDVATYGKAGKVRWVIKMFGDTGFYIENEARTQERFIEYSQLPEFRLIQRRQLVPIAPIEPAADTLTAAIAALDAKEPSQ